MRNDCGHALLVLPILVAEARNEFALFVADHDGAGNDGEGCKCPAGGEAGADAPGEEFAEVSEVDGVSDVLTDSVNDQLLLVVFGLEFVMSAELEWGESTASAGI